MADGNLSDRERNRLSRRDRDIHRRRHGMRVDGKGATLIERLLGERARRRGDRERELPPESVER